VAQKNKTMKKILLSAVAIISITTASMAQTVPNYVPTNGLVGWWPFNGNANDESGNGNNGTVNGATLTADRFGNGGKAYNFDGLSNFIEVQDNNSLDFTNQLSLSIWLKISDYTLNVTGLSERTAIGKQRINDGSGFNFIAVNDFPNQGKYNFGMQTSGSGCGTPLGNQLQIGQYVNIIIVKNSTTLSIYENGILKNSSACNLSLLNSNEPLYIGKEFNTQGRFFKGQIDDIGLWNRALTQQEISDLYNAVNCNNNLTINPQTNNLQTGSAAVFTASTSDVNPTYVWQSDLGQGFQTLNNYGAYSGTTTTTLTISNVQLTNHLQPFRVISTSGNCIDTSATAFIQISDTCVNTVIDTNYVTVTDTNYVTVYDTVTTYISVTDTLFIDINTVGLNNNPVVNTIKVFPNPSNSILNLNYGNYATLNNYRVKITNALGQTIYDQPITQQSETLDLTTFGGNGIYYLSILNPQGNVVEVRKIVLQ
jgi:hypothetical protein